MQTWTNLLEKRSFGALFYDQFIFEEFIFVYIVDQSALLAWCLLYKFLFTTSSHFFHKLFLYALPVFQIKYICAKNTL